MELFGRRLPFSSFHHFLDLTLHQVSLERADMADVELSIQMIGFMQEGSREQVLLQSSRTICRLHPGREWLLCGRA